MYAKFKWYFLNGKSQSHIDLTVGFNCIVCHIFKLFTNQHFNYSVCWQTLGQIKSSILKCCCKVCYPTITRLFYWGEWRKGKTEQTSEAASRFLTESQGVALPPPSWPPLSPCDSAGLRQLPLHSWSACWVSFEVVSCLIGEILPFMCSSPGCQALFTWTVWVA